jgi:hypothetical protein
MSNVATLALATFGDLRTGELLAGQTRGKSGIQFDYQTRCFRAAIFSARQPAWPVRSTRRPVQPCAGLVTAACVVLQSAGVSAFVSLLSPLSPSHGGGTTLWTGPRLLAPISGSRPQPLFC